MRALRVSAKARRLAWAIGIVLLVAVSLLGAQAAVGQVSDAATAGQWTCAGTQWAYAVAGLAAAAGIRSRKSWARPALWIWAGCVSVTGGLAPVVWAGASPLAGITAGLASATVAGIVLLLIHLGPGREEHR